MFCPNCGSPEQSPKSYCRACGVYLQDFDELAKKRVTPRQHLNANLVLTGMTAVAALALAILLYATFLGRDDTPVLIYVTAGFLTAMFFWQAQVIWRNVILKRELPAEPESKRETVISSSKDTNKLLNEADPREFVMVEGQAAERTFSKTSAKSEH